jgi:hypothetical protein
MVSGVHVFPFRRSIESSCAPDTLRPQEKELKREFVNSGAAIAPSAGMGLTRHSRGDLFSLQQFPRKQGL